MLGIGGVTTSDASSNPTKTLDQMVISTCTLDFESRMWPSHDTQTRRNGLCQRFCVSEGSEGSISRLTTCLRHLESEGHGYGLLTSTSLLHCCSERLSYITARENLLLLTVPGTYIWDDFCKRAFLCDLVEFRSEIYLPAPLFTTQSLAMPLPSDS